MLSLTNKLKLNTQIKKMEFGHFIQLELSISEATFSLLISLHLIPDISNEPSSTLIVVFVGIYFCYSICSMIKRLFKVYSFNVLKYSRILLASSSVKL